MKLDCKHIWRELSIIWTGDFGEVRREWRRTWRNASTARRAGQHATMCSCLLRMSGGWSCRRIQCPLRERLSESWATSKPI